MVKNSFFIILKLVGKIWSYFYSNKTSGRISLIKETIYSSWISQEFKSFGNGSKVISFCSLVGSKYISIGEKCILGKNTVLTAWDSYGNDKFLPRIAIGNNVCIGDDAHITCINTIIIGNNVLTGKKVTITDNAHGKSTFDSLLLSPLERPLYSEGAVIIEDGVWIGDKVTILANVRIGKNAIIGSNAVVTKDIPANCVAAGVPAKVIKMIIN